MLILCFFYLTLFLFLLGNCLFLSLLLFYFLSRFLRKLQFLFVIYFIYMPD